MKYILTAIFALTSLPAVAQTVNTPSVAAMVCANNTVVPPPTNGQFFYVQCDSNGKLVTSGGGGSPGGADTQVQFNDGGMFGGNAAFTFTKATGAIATTGVITNTNATASTSFGTGAVKLSGGLGVTDSIYTGNRVSAGTAYNFASVQWAIRNGSTGEVTMSTNAGGLTFTPNNGLSTFTSTVAIGGGSAITSSGAGGALGTNAFTSTAFAPLASPNFTGTPVLSTAQGTSLALGGATIGTNALAVTGSASVSAEYISASTSGGFRAASGGFFYWNVRSQLSSSADGNLVLQNAAATNTAILSWPASATLQHGAADAAAPVAQIEQVQRVVAGTSNTAGALWTFKDSAGTGTAASGGYAWQVAPAGTTGSSQNTFSSAFTIAGGTGLAALPLIATDATHTDTTVCQDTTSHTLYFGSGTAGICLGNVSSIRFKDNWTPLGNAVAQVMAIHPGTWTYKPEYGDPNKVQYGFLAENYAEVLPTLSRFDSEGRPNGVDMMGLVPILTRAIQEQQAEIEALKRRLN